MQNVRTIKSLYFRSFVYTGSTNWTFTIIMWYLHIVTHIRRDVDPVLYRLLKWTITWRVRVLAQLLDKFQMGLSRFWNKLVTNTVVVSAIETKTSALTQNMINFMIYGNVTVPVHWLFWWRVIACTNKSKPLIFLNYIYNRHLLELTLFVLDVHTVRILVGK